MIEWITGAATALKALRESVDWIKKRRSEDSETQAKLNDIVTSSLEFQQALFVGREENEQLRNDLAERDSWDELAAKYELVNAPGGAVVYKYLESPEHYACPTCYQNQTVGHLQSLRSVAGNFECPSCKATYPIDARQAIGLNRPTYP